MRSIATAVVSDLLLSPIQLFAQPKDGLYVVPSFDLYVMVISSGNLVRSYNFKLAGDWNASEGSARGEKIELSSIRSDYFTETLIEENPLGAMAKTLNCTPFYGASGDCDEVDPGQAIEVLTATSDIKAVKTSIA